MTPAQTLARDLVEQLRALDARLGADAPGETVRGDLERAGRTLQAIGALVGVAPRVEITAADVRPKPVASDRCPRCNEKLRLVPSCGFGSTARDICGACGYEPAAA